MAQTNTKGQKLLDRARELQEQFWSTLSELEAEVGFEIDSTQELPGDLEDLEQMTEQFLIL